ncbi:hypothetical protein FPANT_10696 [Fusarium pseudoanthophilum]|uniref:2EXR domain-containing protein n=1 Tax=Fusarium pseudoanthophilum TaxID=48495 RepID=A0A8H5KMC8_9HYPO|nr:hypothetical protein FPANT_10696 [Fusarium pseudoanthophilum]
MPLLLTQRTTSYPFLFFLLSSSPFNLYFPCLLHLLLTFRLLLPFYTPFITTFQDLHPEPSSQVTKMPSTFHGFPRLPVEIQLQIWKEACSLFDIPGYDSHKQAGLHYVNVDTLKSGGKDRLALRALDHKQGPDGDEKASNSNRSAYMWDGGLWGACKLSREVITEKIYSMWLQLPSYNRAGLGRPAILTSRNADEGQGYMVFPRRDMFCIWTTDWKSLPQHFEDCKTRLPFFDLFDPLSSSMVPVFNLAIEFDSSWIVDLPATLEELKAENSARGLVATWMEGVASGCVNTPHLYLIDKATLLVRKTRGRGPIYHDCDGKYNDIRHEWCNDAIYAFIEALGKFLPFEKYGHLYEQNNPDSWSDDVNMWSDFVIFQEINVLARFEYAPRNEVSWTAICNDLSEEDKKGSERAIASGGRVYDLEYDDDVGYCLGSFGGSRGWTYYGSNERCSDKHVDRVEYIKLLDLDFEKVETEVRDE